MAGRRHNVYAPLFMIDEHGYKGPFALNNTTRKERRGCFGVYSPIFNLNSKNDAALI